MYITSYQNSTYSIYEQLHSLIQWSIRLFNIYVKEIILVLRSEVGTGKTRAPYERVKYISFLMKSLKKAENIKVDLKIQSTVIECG